MERKISQKEGKIMMKRWNKEQREGPRELRHVVLFYPVLFTNKDNLL